MKEVKKRSPTACTRKSKEVNWETKRGLAISQRTRSGESTGKSFAATVQSLGLFKRVNSKEGYLLEPFKEKEEGEQKETLKNRSFADLRFMEN